VVVYVMGFCAALKRISSHLQQYGWTGGHFTKWSKLGTEKYCMISLICGICGKLRSYYQSGKWWCPEPEGIEDMGRCWTKGPKFHWFRMDELWQLMDRMVTVIKNNVLCTLNLLRCVDLTCFHLKKEMKD
jgi:hypothetical protein